MSIKRVIAPSNNVNYSDYEKIGLTKEKFDELKKKSKENQTYLISKIKSS